MNGDSALFLRCGLTFSGFVVWGLGTGKMPSKYLYDDREKHPGWFWATGALNAVMAVACFFIAWAEW
jgi:hypothetical protein